MLAHREREREPRWKNLQSFAISPPIDREKIGGFYLFELIRLELVGRSGV